MQLKTNWMANFKLKVLLGKKNTLREHKVNAENVFPYRCQSIKAHVSYRYLIALNTQTENGHKDSPSVYERLVFWQLKTGVRITLLKLSCKLTTHSVRLSMPLN